MSEDKGDFLRRWSRLKRQAAAAPTLENKEIEALQEKALEEKPELPPLESLNFESDFRAFMSAKVEEGVKRAALKKLFSDPRFSVMDGLDTYIDDYSKEDPISEELLAQLKHARAALLGPQKEEGTQPKQAEEEKPAGPESAQTHVDPAQDPQAL